MRFLAAYAAAQKCLLECYLVTQIPFFGSESENYQQLEQEITKAQGKFHSKTKPDQSMIDGNNMAVQPKQMMASSRNGYLMYDWQNEIAMI